MTSDLHHLSAAYALDALEAPERRDFEAHYPNCDICSQEVEDFRRVARELAASVATQPPSNLKAQVLAQVDQTRQLPPRVAARPSTRSTSWPLLAAAAAIALLLGVLGATVLRSDSDVGRADEIVSAPDRVVTTLTPLNEDQPGNLQVVWSDDRDQIVVIGSDLPDPGTDRAYALWFLLDDGVAPAGLFTETDGSVSAVLDIDDIDSNGWGITIEAATGSDQPTTDVLFAGTFTS